jgi:glutathione peroxidase
VASNLLASYWIVPELDDGQQKHSKELSVHKIIKNIGLLALLSQIHAPVFGYQPKHKKAVIPEDKHIHGDKISGNDDKEIQAAENAYAYHLAGPDGKDIPLADFKGKMILLVNLARDSSYNSQLPALIKLNDLYKDKGLVVIGVPSNDFGACEPGTDVEIQKVYKTDDKVLFPVMARSNLIGDEEIPLYSYLTKGKGALPGGDIHWNYTKFLIDRKGKAIVRFKPDVTPDSAEMLAILDEVFSGTYKPTPPERKGPPNSGGSENTI